MFCLGPRSFRGWGIYFLDIICGEGALFIVRAFFVVGGYLAAFCQSRRKIRRAFARLPEVPWYPILFVVFIFMGFKIFGVCFMSMLGSRELEEVCYGCEEVFHTYKVGGQYLCFCGSWVKKFFLDSHTFISLLCGYERITILSS